MLFPEPVRELNEVSKEMGARILYDASHVLGLIAGGQFQRPFYEGADVMLGSTHKTLPGPQKGIILVKEDQKLAEKISEAIFPALTDNHHINNVAGLAIALSEMVSFGEAYAKQIIKNSKALASSLFDEEFNVLCPDEGFTETHQVIINGSNYGGGSLLAERLEEANIIATRYMIPGDLEENRDKPNGLRIGVSEVTRLGMKEAQMGEISELFKRLIMDGEEVVKVRRDVTALAEQFNKVHYCFDDQADAYKYFELGRKC
jgi:glycine hydroxymethyltransferase